VDLRVCKPNGSLTINKSVSLGGIEKGSYDLFLNITDQDENLSKRPEYSIRLANSNVWEESTGMNNLQKKVTVD
jgi:hypothetical protein